MKQSEIPTQFKKDIESIDSLTDLEKLQVKYLGRNGIINKLLLDIRNQPLEKRKEFGMKVNELKTSIKHLIEVKRGKLHNKRQSGQYYDVTLPGKTYPQGSLHLVTYAIEEISEIFARIGFIRMTYPEIEWEHFAFDALNMPPGHPARDDFETFFVDAPPSSKYGKMILSPHTSSGQVREMLRVGNPPIRMISIAKCYRPNWDLTHTPMFHQFESLCVDENITITNLKGTISYFVKEYFGEESEVRLRPFHFQFTEPSFEVDITCTVCRGKGCRVCKSGWLELAGAGMVHPNVLKAGKIDAEKYTGWAFAFGIERLIMIQTRLNNMRILYDGDIRFLEQF